MCRSVYPMSEEESVAQLRPWVEKGKAWAQNMLGGMYVRGGNLRQARQLWELAARQGHANAQYNLGCMHERGHGVVRSFEKASDYYQAAGAGAAQARCMLHATL